MRLQTTHYLLSDSIISEIDLTIGTDEAVLQQTALAQLQKPNPQDLGFLTEWLDRPDMGGIYLEGQDSDVWEKPDRLDLIVMKSRKNESWLSAWMSDSFIHWYHWTIGSRLTVGNSGPEVEPMTVRELANVFTRQKLFDRKTAEAPPPPANVTADPEAATPSSIEPNFPRLDSIAQLSRTTHHSQTTTLRIARVISLALASLLPLASIVILYYVKSMPKRLGIVGFFTAAFSTILGLVTNGELVAVFAASSA